MAEYWLEHAPKLEGWTFYPARQPSNNVREFSLRLNGDMVFEPKELWLHLRVDEDDKNIDITAWHPLYSRIPDNAKFTSLYLLLDETLGEYGTQKWIREIKLADDKLKESVPIWELPDFIKRMKAEKGWEKPNPTSSYSCYRVDDPKDGLRNDIFVGSARSMRLVEDYLDAEGPIDHPVPGMGADLVFVAMSSQILPKGEEVAFRGNVEDDIVATFERNGSGESLGGGTGMQNSYIDLVIYDGENSIKQILDVLKKHGLPRGTAIHYFTKDKARLVHKL
jgi:hypothetical protein